MKCKNKNILVSLIITTIVFSLSPVLADDVNGSAKKVTDCGKRITEALRALDEVEGFIPLVPKDEATYLDDEMAAATKVNSSSRINALMQRPFYNAWNLHQEIIYARGSLEDIPLPPERGIKIQIQMAVRASWKVTRAKKAWDDYVNADNLDVLSLRQVAKGIYEMMAIESASGQYIWCLAEQIEDKK